MWISKMCDKLIYLKLNLSFLQAIFAFGTVFSAFTSNVLLSFECSFFWKEKKSYWKSNCTVRNYFLGDLHRMIRSNILVEAEKNEKTVAACHTCDLKIAISAKEIIVFLRSFLFIYLTDQIKLWFQRCLTAHESHDLMLDYQ